MLQCLQGEIGIFDTDLCVGVWTVDLFPAAEPAVVFLEETASDEEPTSALMFR